MVMLGEVCRKIIEIGEKEGADQIEGFVINGKMVNLYVEAGKPSIVTYNTWIGVGIKSVIGKRVGFISGIYRNDEDLKKLIRDGIRIARIAPEDEKFESLPEPKSITGHVEGVYDEEAENIDSEGLASYANMIIENAEKDDVRVMKGLIRINIFEFQVMNSLGVDYTHKGTNIFVHFLAKKEMGEGIIKRYSTMLNGIDWENAGVELHEKTILASRAKPYTGMETLDVIVEPMELAGMLTAILVAVNGENINRHRSPWIGKIGEKVAEESFTMIDDGRMKYGLKSALADDEGVPTTRKPIIEKGVLKNYLFDYYNARIAKVEPRGNGFRRGTRTIEGTHKAPAGTAPSNIEITPGNKDLDTLMAEMDKGLVVEKFAIPNVDFITGNFGMEIRSAIMIEEGEKKQPIKHALLIGNLYKALNNITGIAKKREQIGAILLPAIRFRNLQVVGLGG